MRNHRIDIFFMVITICSCLVGTARTGQVWEYEASETLRAVEMDHGDTLKFRLRDGDVRTLILDDTSAEILERNDGGVVYGFECQVRIDGHPLTLRRYVCTQESFYEPYVVNGLRIWPDSVLAIYDKVPMRYPKEGNLRYRPRKAARFALQDATLPICPQPMRSWYPNETGMIDVGDCYNGDDCWMGPYLGEACHGGMDINHERGEPLWAPIDFDDQWDFNSLKAGHNNNRWRGVRRWPNGDLWALQTHHHIRLLVPEHTPLQAGTHYAEAAGVHVGSHHHTHFEFKVAHQPQRLPVDFDDPNTEPASSEQPTVIHLDPWIIFWQIFETARVDEGQTCAAMKPLGPATTGRLITFDGTMSKNGNPQDRLHYRWTLGDGGVSDQPIARHSFTRPGIYAVTLTVDDGARRDSVTQLLTVDGTSLTSPALTVVAPDEPAFGKRAPEVLDVYRAALRGMPHTLAFVARPSRPAPKAKTIYLRNDGSGVLPAAAARVVEKNKSDWLKIALEGTGNHQQIDARVDAEDLDAGVHTACVEVKCPGALNSPQRFWISLTIPENAPAETVIVDDRDPGCYFTPHFWVGHKFCRCSRRGYRDFYLTNGGRAADDHFVRFTPDLAAGSYRVAFRSETPFRENAAFRVRVRSASGDHTLTVRPAESRVLGTFAFHGGADGFVEIQAKGSTGLVMADAVEFIRIDE